MDTEELHAVAKAIVSGNKGVLAADESNPTIKKRFDAIGLACTEDNRRRYRELLFTSDGIEQYLGGVILFDETLRQSSRDGVAFAQLLSGRGIMPGIKVDRGTTALARHPGEQITEGLDGLGDRLAEYRQRGATFAKWRAVIEIDMHGIPTHSAIAANAHALARYAALCQQHGIVPVVEPEVLMDGSHDIDRCEAVTSRVLTAVFSELRAQRVLLEGMLLKPNMVIPGLQCPHQADLRQVAEATMRTLRRCVPVAVPGIVFLSGGQPAQLATGHLQAMNTIGPHPWPVSFSYGRALQAPVLEAWKGKEANVAAAQRALLQRCRLNALACEGKYISTLEAAT